MAIPLPNLDDRTFADLVEEARAAVPGLAPGWTDHNPADPGVALVELFAWITEILVYRTNRIPDANRRVFAKLLDGAAPAEAADVDEALRRSVVRLRQEERAVTAADYERLSTAGFNAWLEEMRRVERGGGSLEVWWSTTRLAPAEANQPTKLPRVARARGVARRDLGAESEAARLAPRPGDVSVLVVPERGGEGDAAPAAPPALRRAVRAFLEDRRLLTTRLHVAAPVYVPVRVRARVVRRADVPEGDVRRRIAAALAAFADPLTGGPDGRGWPFGRDLFASELYALLEGVEGVDHVPHLELASECEGAGCVEAPVLWHVEGAREGADMDATRVGLGMAEHHLPRLAAPVLHLAPAALAVRVEVEAKGVAEEDREAAVRDAADAVRRFFDPAHGGPGEHAEPLTLRVADLRARLAETGHFDAASLELRLRADPARLLVDENGETTGVHFRLRELAEVRLGVTVKE